MVKAGLRGNFIFPDSGVDFYSFAERFKLATEGVETDVTMDESDYTAQTNIENSTPRKKKNAKKKAKEKIVARTGESPQDAVKRHRREQEAKRRRESARAVEDFESTLGTSRTA